jgi:hypothetical protein
MYLYIIILLEWIYKLFWSATEETDKHWNIKYAEIINLL